MFLEQFLMAFQLATGSQDQMMEIEDTRPAPQNSLRTSMLMSGILWGTMELVASWITKDRSKSGRLFNRRVVKMFFAGALIGDPVEHILRKLVDVPFRNRTGFIAVIFRPLLHSILVSLPQVPRSRHILQ